MMNSANVSKNTGHPKSKLFKLKEWVTGPEAAMYLTTIFGENVNDTDVLKFVLDGHLKLSINFVNYTYAKQGKFLPLQNSESHYPEISLRNNGVIEFENKVTKIGGVWDLPMIGMERHYIESLFQKLTGGPDVQVLSRHRIIQTSLDFQDCFKIQEKAGGKSLNNGHSGVGCWVQRDNNTICQLQESYDQCENVNGSKAQLKILQKIIATKNINKKRAMDILTLHKKNREIYLKEKEEDPYCDYFIAGFFPNDALVVVRTQSLIDFQERLMHEESKKEKPLGPRAEKTYLNIIGAMLEVLKGDHGKGKFTNETDLKDFLTQKYSGFPGISERNLSKKFFLAKKSISEELN